MTIAIIEDIDSIRNNYQKYLEAEPEFSKVNSFPTAEDFFTWLEEEQKIPDVLLLDIGLPGMSGIDCIKKIKQLNFPTEIIMLTVYDDSDRIFKSLCAGASSYLLKASPLSKIKESILTASSGNSSMSPSIARKVIEYFMPKKSNQLLTTKELQIVQGLVDGLSYKLIADRLNISINTVRQHISNIYLKLHVHSKTEVISRSLKGEL